MLNTMTSPEITFDEEAFVKEVLKRFETNTHHNNNDDIYDDYFYSVFPTNEIREAIRNKYYLDEWYDRQSLHNILYTIVDIEYDKYEDSVADTEDFKEEEFGIDEIHDIDEEEEYYEGDDYD